MADGTLRIASRRPKLESPKESTPPENIVPAEASDRMQVLKFMAPNTADAVDAFVYMEVLKLLTRRS